MSENITSEQTKSKIKRNKFTSEEDQKVIALVQIHGTNAWEEISKGFDFTRDKRQLRERWQAYLDPNRSTEWTQEEDDLLVSLYEKYGSKWARIAECIGNKSNVLVRNRHRTLLSLKAKGLRPEYSGPPSPPTQVAQPFGDDSGMELQLAEFGYLDDLLDVSEEERYWE